MDTLSAQPTWAILSLIKKHVISDLLFYTIDEKFVAPCLILRLVSGFLLVRSQKRIEIL